MSAGIRPIRVTSRCTLVCFPREPNGAEMERGKNVSVRRVDGPAASTKRNVTVVVIVENKNHCVATLYFLAGRRVRTWPTTITATTLLLLRCRICPAPGRTFAIGRRPTVIHGVRDPMPTRAGRVPSLCRRYYYYRNLYRCWSSSVFFLPGSAARLLCRRKTTF